MSNDTILEGAIDELYPVALSHKMRVRVFLHKIVCSEIEQEGENDREEEKTPRR